MLSKRKLPNYCDGVLEIFTSKKLKTDFNAKRNVNKRSDMDFVGSLCYSIQTKREQDYEFAERNSFSLSLKLKTPRFDLVNSDCLILIGTTLFSVSSIDKTVTEMYLYLMEVGEIDPE